MKAAIYNPYLDTLGGGERYTLSFANVLAKNGYDVDLAWEDNEILKKVEDRFGIKLHNNIQVVSDIQRGEGYNICFWVSDGSIPTLKASRNFIHFQVPFKNVNGRSLLNRMKLFRVEKIITNSLFTKKVIDEEYGVSGEVIYPPIDVNLFKRKKKENIILYVGRFSDLTQSKHQEVLVNSFKELVDSNQFFSNWRLILAGGVEIGTDKFVNKLEELSRGYNIDIIKSPDFDSLKNLYGRAKIFWSAAGYGEDELENPHRFEHFGITVVEAMAAGCIPIVFNGGGHKEIIGSDEYGYLWQNTKDLLEITKKIIEKKGEKVVTSKKLSERAKLFSSEVFEKHIKNFI